MAIELLLAVPGVESLYGYAYYGSGVYGGTTIPLLTLPEGLTFMVNDFGVRRDQINKAFADGAAILGDELEARDIVISGTLFGTTASEHKTLMKSIRAACYRANMLRYESGSSIGVLLKRLRHRWKVGTDRTFSEIEITFAAADPFFFEDAVRSSTFEVLGNGNLAITPTDSASATLQWRVHPKITVTAAANMSSFGLKNITDGGLQFTYNEAIAPGAIVVIDCYAGTVVRSDLGDANKIQFFDGEFISLLPQAQTLEYTGGAATVVVSYRPRWL